MGDFEDKKYPSYNQYPSDWIAHCAHLRPTTYKAFHMILQFMWLHSPQQCRILNDKKTLGAATLLQGRTLDRAMEDILDPDYPLLVVDGKFLLSKRLRKERERYLALSRKKSNNARGIKEPSGRSTDAQRMPDTRSAIPSSISNPSSSSYNDQPPTPYKGIIGSIKHGCELADFQKSVDRLLDEAQAKNLSPRDEMIEFMVAITGSNGYRAKGWKRRIANLMLKEQGPERLTEIVFIAERDGKNKGKLLTDLIKRLELEYEAREQKSA